MKDTKDLILETAYTMFLYNNYEAVTINAIIKSTGLTKGAIYHYYASKEDLFKAVVDKYVVENMIDSVNTFNSLQDFIKFIIDSVEVKIERFLEKKNDSSTIIPINYLSLVIAAHRYYPGYTQIGEKFFQAQKKRWEDHIKDAIANGEIRDNIDTEAIISSFMNVGSGIISNSIMFGSMSDALKLFERQYRQLYDFIKK